MAALTVFTPAYNRADLLPRCYESMKRQTRKDFIWMVIDDGSTDNTEELVKGWIADTADFAIEYYRKENGGLHTAYNEAIAHIAKHSTGHSEAIVTANDEAAARFTAAVDSAAVYVNASTRFTDGGEFGLGCEMGISTQKLHARGPMGLCELTSYKYVIRGNGQTR